MKERDFCNEIDILNKKIASFHIGYYWSYMLLGSGSQIHFLKKTWYNLLKIEEHFFWTTLAILILKWY